MRAAAPLMSRASRSAASSASTQASTSAAASCGNASLPALRDPAIVEAGVDVRFRRAPTLRRRRVCSSQRPTASSALPRATADSAGAASRRQRLARAPHSAAANCAGVSATLQPARAVRSGSAHSRSASASAARRTAAAGLFNSCARPAASVPSAVIFSRCWALRVASRTRSDIMPTRRRPNSWLRRSMSSNRSLCTVSSRVSVRRHAAAHERRHARVAAACR